MPNRNLPHIHLLCMETKHSDAFTTAIQTHWPGTTVDSRSSPTIIHTSANTSTRSSPDPDQTVDPFAGQRPPLPIYLHNSSLANLPSTTNFDLIVSPANSYGRLDGSFDDAISRAFCLPDHPYNTLTNAAQDVLYDKYRGFAPPGSCTLVSFPKQLRNSTGAVVNKWGCEWLAICPTMRMPSDVTWDREVVYECVWSLLCAVEKHNRDVFHGNIVGKNIKSILLTPMATGCGMVTPQRWSEQAVLAMRHFVNAAVQRPERWRRMEWESIMQDAKEVRRTWKGHSS